MKGSAIIPQRCRTRAPRSILSREVVVCGASAKAARRSSTSGLSCAAIQLEAIDGGTRAPVVAILPLPTRPSRFPTSLECARVLINRRKREYASSMPAWSTFPGGQLPTLPHNLTTFDFVGRGGSTGPNAMAARRGCRERMIVLPSLQHPSHYVFFTSRAASVRATILYI